MHVAKRMFLIAAGIAVAIASAEAGASNEIAWGDSLDKAKERGAAEGKLLLVDFWKEH